MAAKRKTAKKKVYVGYIEYKFEKRDIEAMIKQAATNEMRHMERQIDDYVKLVRTMKRKIEKLEIQVAKLELKKK